MAVIPTPLGASDDHSREASLMTVVAIKQAPADPRPMPASADAEGAT